MREREKLVILNSLSVLGLFAISLAAFSKKDRLAWGKKKGWECEEDDCDKRFQDDWMVEFHHKKPVAQGGEDTEDNAELLCQKDHYKKHIFLEDLDGARLIGSRLKKTGGRTNNWLNRNKK